MKDSGAYVMRLQLREDGLHVVARLQAPLWDPSLGDMWLGADPATRAYIEQLLKQKLNAPPDEKQTRCRTVNFLIKKTCEHCMRTYTRRRDRPGRFCSRRCWHKHPKAPL